jgi:hypothetical protein
MIRRRQVAFLHVVAIAGFADAALQIDAEPVDHVARPAAAVALHFERLFGREDAAIAGAFDVEQEVALLAEQAEAAADLPGDLQRSVGRGLRGRLGPRECRKAPRKQNASEDGAKSCSDHGDFALLIGYGPKEDIGPKQAHRAPTVPAD